MSEWIAGYHAVTEILRAGKRKIHRAWLLEGSKTQELKAAAKEIREAGLQPEWVDRQRLVQTVGTRQHSGMAVEAEEYPYASIKPFWDQLSKTPILAAMDRIQDPQNLGAILRSARFFGIEGIALPTRHSAEITPAVVRASAGATEHLNILQVVNLASFMKEASDRGFFWVGAVAEGGVGLEEIEFRAPMGWVIGNEADGMRKKTEAHCDALVTLPSDSPIQSLNASACAAICFHHTQRHFRSS